MNETVYLFALSVPDLLEALVANQDRSITDTSPDEPEVVHVTPIQGRILGH